MQRRTAISYARFSDPKQAEGDSLTRQAEMFCSFCQQHNLTPLKDVFADKGRSGFKGVHLKKGQLGDLLKAAQDGRFERGTVVVVEAWDRLGRLRPDLQTELVKAILLTGVHIGIAKTGAIFQESDFGTDHWLTFSTFAYLAHQESKQKSERIAASCLRKRERAKVNGAAFSGRLPAWLRIVKGQMVTVPERVFAVKRIFQLSAEGYGQARIIRTLGEEGIKPMGRSVNGWGHSYIQLLLTDNRVKGQLVLVDGTVLPNYYPRIIEDDLFNLARKIDNGERDKLGRKSGPRDVKHVNTFQGLLTSALDGEGFFLHKKRDRLMLEGAAGANGRGKSQTFPFDVFEEAILGKLKEINPADVLPWQTDRPSTVDLLRAKLADIRSDIAGLQADLRSGYSKALAAVLRDKEQEEIQIAGELQDELAASVRPAERAWEELPSLVNLIKEHGDEARLRIRSVLRSIIEDARLLLVRRDSYTLAGVQINFQGGAVRHYLVIYRQACSQRARDCRTLDFKRTGQKPLPAVPDLRDPEQARRFALRLQALDLSD